jgi:hypothetical protein
MHCLRCRGLMVTIRLEDVGSSSLCFSGWQCLMCGEVIDSVIAANRKELHGTTGSRGRIRYGVSLGQGRLPSRRREANAVSGSRNAESRTSTGNERTNQRGRESLLPASSARVFSSSPGLLSWSVELRSLKGYRFGEDLRIAYAREIGHIYSRPAGSATD